ncbi:MAG: hypothetical protein IK104_10320 [Clostridia bacterium]|nr:hypothetical protein [Clostridia bacterium]
MDPTNMNGTPYPGEGAQPNAAYPPYQPYQQAPAYGQQTYPPYQQPAPPAQPAAPAYDTDYAPPRQEAPAYPEYPAYPQQPQYQTEAPVYGQQPQYQAEAPAYPQQPQYQAETPAYPQQQYQAAEPAYGQQGYQGAAYQPQQTAYPNTYQPQGYVPADAQAARPAPEAPKKKKKTGLIVGLIAGLVAVGAAVAVVLLVVMPQQKYNKAKDLLNAGDYDAAYDAFEALGDYKDSADMLDEVRYRQAKDYLRAKQYDKAYDAFDALGSYADSRKMLKEVTYLKACGALDDENYATAYQLFKKLPGYAGADEKLEETLEAWTEAVLASGADAELYEEYVELDDEQIETVYTLVTDYIDDNSDLTMDQWRYYLAANALAVVNKLPEDYGKTEYVRDILTWMTGGGANATFYENNTDAVSALWNTDWIKGLFSDGWALLGFLTGNWSTYSGDYYFNMVCNGGDSFTSSYNVPWVEKPEGTKFFCVDDYVYYHDNENNEHLAEVFRFTLVKEDRIEIYSYKNSTTYTLYR